MESLGYDSKKVPFVSGSALQALNGIDTEYGKQSIIKLMSVCDSQIPLPERDLNSPFLMPIEKTVPIPGRGQVLVGTCTRGILKKSSPLEIIGFSMKKKNKLFHLHLILFLIIFFNIKIFLRQSNKNSCYRYSSF